MSLKIPVGIEDFELIRKNKYYYVDKTKFISDLLPPEASVYLITRPRRFGKTLTLSMLKSFLDIDKDSKDLFEGLVISQNHSLCREWMNQWPVISFSFKGIYGSDYKTAYSQLAYFISDLTSKYSFLLDSERINKWDKDKMLKLLCRTADEVELKNSLSLLTHMLHLHYGKQVIILIDEYDVPLAKAKDNGYYAKMLDLLKGMMEFLKSNFDLRLAVITGCLRIAKESIFTGMNHLLNNSIDRGSFMDSFGFTEADVIHILQENGLYAKLPEVKKWYDGYRFGNYEIYCPWDVTNYVKELLDNTANTPGSYWKSTSHNNIIRSFIDSKALSVQGKFETLLSGGSISARIKDDLTYDFDRSDEDNFWSILYLTGYLTKEVSVSSSTTVQLKIPNEEIKTIFEETIVAWFTDSMERRNREELFQAWWNGDSAAVTEYISDILFSTISYYDYKEDYYHAFVAGLFVGADYQVTSNREMGLGRSDIVIRDPSRRRAIIIEIKHSSSEDALNSDCDKALRQIQDNRYIYGIEKGYHTLIGFGISFYKKSCMAKALTAR